MTTPLSVKEIQENVNLLEFSNNKTLYLIGTAHVSKDSVDLVESLILDKEPDTVCVELDEKRHKSLLKKNIYDDIDIIQVIKKKQLFFFIGQFLLSSFQKKISEQTGVRPGDELRKAVECAENIGADLVLADRDIGVTLKRAWRLTPFGHKMSFLGGLISADEEDFKDLDIEELKKKDAVETMVQSFSEELPKAKEVLIDERDTFLTSEIQKNLGDVTVAVVGAGHVPGILKKISEKIPQETQDSINIVPPPGLVGKILPWMIPAIFAGLMIWGFTLGRKDMAKDAIIFWILANGILTSLGCLISLAHPLTIVAGFIAAPITSLNPAIGAGFVTAFVQTLLVRPRVKDFEQIHEKALKIRHWWNNRVTKIFLVFILSSLGSTIGTFVALPALTRIFGG